MKLIVCITGMPGAGKSTIANEMKLKGFYVISMGNIIRNIAKKQNIDPTRNNMNTIMHDIRKKYGPGIVANLMKDEILSTRSSTIIVDGIRSNNELDIFKKIGNVKILSVHASVDTRYSFLLKRNRSDDPQNKKNFNDRDNNEINIGISSPIVLADESISNNNLTLTELLEKAYKIIVNWTHDIHPTS